MTTTEIVPVEQPATPATLFGTDDAKAIIASATNKAEALASVVRQKKLFTPIQGREYVRVEGWTLLGTMLGVFPVCDWTRPLEDGWEARVEARTLDGRVVGAAEAQCTRTERTWKERDDYALRSMAQTRATAKALRVPLGFVMALAGYEATPAEEMSFDVIEGEAKTVAAPRQQVQTTSTEAASAAQKGMLFNLGRKLGWDADKTKEEVGEFSGSPWDEMSKTRASAAIKHLQQKAGE